MKTRHIALLLAVSLIAGLLGGCTSGKSTKTAATYNGGEIPAGVYIYNQITALNEAYNKVADTSKDVLKQEIDGVPAEQWVNDRAALYTRRFAVAESECTRLGLSVDETTAASLKQSVDNAWESEGEWFEKNGVSRSSIDAVSLNTQKLQLLFSSYYGVGGEKEIPEAELLAYYKENYRRAFVMIVSKYDQTTNKVLEGDALTAREAEINDYLARAKAGESLFSLVVEQNEKAKASGDASAKTDLVESQQEVVLSKSNTTYDPDFITQLFDGSAMNTPELFENDSYAILFERRDLVGDKTNFEASRASLMSAIKGAGFTDELAAMADSIGFSLNDAAVKRFKPSNISAQ